MRFTKMQGLGNDFLLVYDQVPENAGIICARLCDRHFGAGADGVIYLSPSPVADFAMRIFNADGSEAKMCGNGIRCAGKFLYDKGFTQKEHLTIETHSGITALTLRAERGRVSTAAVDMGPAVIKQASITLQEGIGAGALVSVGNPHVVIFTNSVEDIPIYLWGPRVEKDPRFPDGVNAEFVQVLSPGQLRMRVWERGCGVTLACGTGACASTFAAVKQGFCPANRPVEVKLDGGSLLITVSPSDSILMEGPAVTVYEGEIEV